jgi:hypothetical protein
MWYWYCTGIVTVLFVQSVLLNIGLATGYIKWNKNKYPAPVCIYDQDASGEIYRTKAG